MLPLFPSPFLCLGTAQEHFNDGDVICQQGGAWDRFHVVAKGTVVATTARGAGEAGGGGGGGGGGAAGDGGAREVLSMGPGQHFGERHLLGASVRPASMVARGDVSVLTMTRAAFEALFGPLPELLAAYTAWRSWSEAQRELLRRSPLLGAGAERVLAVSEAERNGETGLESGCQGQRERGGHHI